MGAKPVARDPEYDEEYDGECHAHENARGYRRYDFIAQA